MCIATITLPVQNQVNERYFVLLPLHYLYKARKMSGHVYCYHYTTCTKPGKLPVMCIVTIALHNTKYLSFTWFCTGSVMVAIHMTAHLPSFVQLV
jgi:hypothetical protein